MLKKLCTWTLLMGSLSVNVGCAYSSQNAPPISEANPHHKMPSIEGQVWTGTDSDGDFYEFHFLKGGQLRYASQTPSESAPTTYEDEGDIWVQNGSTVVMLINNYSSYQGIYAEGRITGDAWNFAGQRWTWDIRRKTEK